MRGVGARICFSVGGRAPVFLGIAVVAVAQASAPPERWCVVLSLSATATATALVQAAYPLAPPRLYQPSGTIDTLVRFGPTYHGTIGDESGVINTYGAMPSMHVGWALLAVLPRRPWLTVLSILSVATMTWTVIVTGNHYLLDPVVGVAIVLVCTGIAWIGPRWHIRRPIRLSARLRA